MTAPRTTFAMLAAGVALALTSLTALSACGSDDASSSASSDAPITTAAATATNAPTTAATTVAPAPAAALDIVAADFTLEMSSGTVITDGVVPVRLVNKGEEPHEVIVARLNDGETRDSFIEAFHHDEEAAQDVVTYVGGASVVEPGDETTGYATLEAGRYVAICFVPSDDGASHVDKGMVAEFEVVASGSPLAAPVAVADVRFGDYAIFLPASGLSQPGVYRFRNEGKEPHEMILLHMAEGKTIADLGAYIQSGLTGEPPFTYAGGAGAIAPGDDGYAELDLGPGNYVALCAILSPTTHKPHVEMGMLTPFEIPAA